jgi:hypothetical protein
MNQTNVYKRKTNFIISSLLALSIMACFTVMSNAVAADKPLKIFILSGQSNMQGKAKVRTIERLNMTEDSKALYKDMTGKDGKPVTVKDTYAVYFTATRGGNVFKGPLNPYYGEEGDPAKTNFGPEYTFGIYMQKHLNEPFLIIKTAWGGKDLIRQFRPPSEGAYPLSKEKIEQLKAAGKLEATLAKNKEETHKYYRLMMEHVNDVLKDPSQFHPAYNKKAGYEIAGFVWFQGWNDLVNGYYKDSGAPLETMYTPYSGLMASFIRDVRKDLKTPAMPFVIGVLGVDGPKDKSEKMHWFRNAQEAPAMLPEFKGNVKAVRTEFCWDMKLKKLTEKVQAAAWEKVKKDNPEILKKVRAAQNLKNKYYKELLSTVLTPEELKLKQTGESNAGYHYNGSAYIYGNIGKAFAEAMIEMDKTKN